MANKITIKIPASEKNSYPIWINSGLLKKTHWLPKNSSIANVVVITDNNVKKIYAAPLIRYLKQQKYSTLLLSFPAGEKSKTEKTKQFLAEQMMRYRCGRDTLCIALGGGVVGDLTGYLAATYMRGVPYIQIPTTLLAMVDSSVGGKTGLNTPYGKNLMGAFYQPKAVITDIDSLKSLSQKQFVNGLIEAAKMFLTNDKKSFLYLEKNLDHILKKDPACLTSLLHRAVKIKATVVEEDEKEQGLRMVLNFGHTIGHALEQITQYKMLHGHAVAFGLLVEAKIAEIIGVLDNNTYLRIETLLSRLGFKGSALKKFTADQIIDATRLDKKSSKGKTHYILLKNIGQVYEVQKNFAHNVSDHIVKKAFLELIRGNTYARQ